MTATTTATTDPINFLIDAVAPSLDDAMVSCEVLKSFVGTDDFKVCNDKWMDEYIERNFKDKLNDGLKKLGSPTDTSTPSKSSPKPSKSSKSTKSTKADKAPAKPAKPTADSNETPPTNPVVTAKSGKVEISLTPAEKAKREKQLFAVTETVRKETGNIATAYMRIGYELWKVQEHKLYLAADLKNVYEYAETAFGFKKSSAINFIAVCKKFSCKTPLGLPTDKIDPAFALFGYSQLSLMLPLSDETLSNVKPEMTANEIRDLKKGHSSDQSDEETPAPASKTKSVYYDGSVTSETWDRLLEKLEKLIDSGKHIQITVTE